MHISQHPTHTLELRVHALAQLFNSLDPTPFLNKDLDVACERFIENWALSLPHASHLALTIHVVESPVPPAAVELVTAAIHNHYAYKAGLVRGELSQLLRLGRTSLLIGLGFVAGCLLLAEAVSSIVSGPIARIIRESLT